MRWILHADMDAFFAAVEVLDDPSLAGRPVIVGGTPQGHGVVATASYEARAFGVHSAMPAAVAVKLCSHGTFLRPRPERYREVSRQIFSVFQELTPLVEPLSIDEAFLDVTSSPLMRRPDASRTEHDAPSLELDAVLAVARTLQARVEEATGGLTCSVGVAENKFLAKVASDLKKPCGLVGVPPGRGAEFLAGLTIEKLWGVGPRTAKVLHRVGLRRVSDAARLSREDLEHLVGIDLGRHIHRLCRGEDDRPVVTERRARSISQETTLARFIPAVAYDEIETLLFGLSEAVARRARASGVWGRTITLKVRDHRFRTCTRSRTLAAPTHLAEEIDAAARGLYRERIAVDGRKIRLLGVSLSGLASERVRQLELFDDGEPAQARQEEIASILDAARSRLGTGALTRARLLSRPPPKDER